MQIEIRYVTKKFLKSEVIKQQICSCSDFGEEPSFGLRLVEADKRLGMARGYRHVHSQVLRWIAMAAIPRYW
jgi:hypothetical protein